MFKSKLLFFALLILSIFLFFRLDLNQYLNPEYFISKKREIDSIYQASPFLFVSAFFLFYVFCATLSLPGAALLTLVSGFLFDFFIGLFVVSFGSTCGATCAFLLSRFFLRDFIQKRFHSRLEKVNKGFKKEGAFYLFSLRLIPILPFFFVNTLMGLTPISIRHFILASFLGMLPGSIVYVNAGKQLEKMKSLAEVFSPSIILSFLVLALLPWIMKLFLRYLPLRKPSYQ